MKNRGFILVTAILLTFVLASEAFAFPFPLPFFGNKPKAPTESCLFGIVIGPSNINQPGSGYMPVEGAVVKVSNEHNTYSYVTTKEGGYQFEKMKPGKYTISVSKPGFGGYVEQIEVAKADFKRMPNITLVPGAGLSTPQGVIVPDTVYVAFAKIEAPKNASPTSHWRKAAINSGADPLTLEGNIPYDPSTQYNPYDKGNQISAYENSLMTIDPKNTEEIGYVKMDSNPTWLSFNVSGTKLYVATEGNFVLVYDILNSSILIGSIPLPAPATDMKITPDGRVLFISHHLGIKVVDTKTNAQINEIPVPNMADGSPGIPMGIAVSRDGLRIYVALSTFTGGEIVCIDSYSKQPVGRAPCGTTPVGLALSPDGSRLFSANYNAASVSMLSTSPLQLITNIPVGVSPNRLTVSPDGGKVYVSCKGSNTVSIISSAGSQLGSIPVGKEPMGVGLTSDGTRLYVANHADGTVSIIDTASNFVLKTTRAQPHARPWGVAVKP